MKNDYLHLPYSNDLYATCRAACTRADGHDDYCGHPERGSPRDVIKLLCREAGASRYRTHMEEGRAEGLLEALRQQVFSTLRNRGEVEEQHEDDDGKHHGREMQEEGHRPREQLCLGQQRAERGEEDAQAAGDDDDEGHEQEDADVVRNLSGDGARAFDVPDGVERLLDVGGQREQRVEQEDTAASYLCEKTRNIIDGFSTVE